MPLSLDALTTNLVEPYVPPKFTKAQRTFLFDTIIEPWGGTPDALAQRYVDYLRVHVRATEFFQETMRELQQLRARDRDPATRPAGLSTVDELRARTGHGLRRYGWGPTTNLQMLRADLALWHAFLMQERSTTEEWHYGNTIAASAIAIMDEYYLIQPLKRKDKLTFELRMQDLMYHMHMQEVPHRAPNASYHPVVFPQPPVARPASNPVGGVYVTPSKSGRAVQSTATARAITKPQAEALALDFGIFQKRFLLPPQTLPSDRDESDNSEEDEVPDTWRVAVFDQDKKEYGVVFPKLSPQPLSYDRGALISLMLESKML